MTRFRRKKDVLRGSPLICKLVHVWDGGESSHRLLHVHHVQRDRVLSVTIPMMRPPPCYAVIVSMFVSIVLNFGLVTFREIRRCISCSACQHISFMKELDLLFHAV